MSRVWGTRSSNRSRFHHDGDSDSERISKMNDEEGKIKEPL